MFFILEWLSHIWFLVSHVSCGRFQKPMTPEEERAYVEKCRAGDREARDVLIERNLRLVAHVVKKYVGASEDQDDLISVGTIGLIKAIHTFDPDKSNKLSTYAARCIENEILMLFRSDKKRAGDVSLQDMIGEDKEGNEVSLLDILPSEDEDIAEAYESKTDAFNLRSAVEQVLFGREKKVIELRYGLLTGRELPQREVAKLLGISRSYVSRIEKKALEKLKLALEASGDF